MPQQSPDERIAQLQDECLELTAKLSGKRMELAVATGQADEARVHMQAMYAAIQQRYATRHQEQQ